MPLQASEFVLNSNGSVYHLNLYPDEIASTIIFVGDPDRVARVSQHFDRIDVKKQKREFVTHTGWLGKTRLTVMSTGIGIGCIDIAMNELDALVNIDFKTREIKQDHTVLTILRLGTCGGLSENMQLHDLVYSAYSFGFDGMLNFYHQQLDTDETKLLDEIHQHFVDLPVTQSVYVAKASSGFAEQYSKRGITLTCPGFYGPQYRQLRAPVIEYDFLKAAQTFGFNDLQVLNYEMETSAILGMGKLLGHHCASLSTVLANRVTGEFSDNTQAAVDAMIEKALDSISLDHFKSKFSYMGFI